MIFFYSLTRHKKHYRKLIINKIKEDKEVKELKKYNKSYNSYRAYQSVCFVQLYHKNCNPNYSKRKEIL